MGAVARAAGGGAGMMLDLWTINRVVRWSGFRVVIVYDNDEPISDRVHRVGLVWVGLPRSPGWNRMKAKW